MMPFWKVSHVLRRKRNDIMAEELEKYKKILKREDEEFKEVMKAEVNVSLPSNSSKLNERYNSGKIHVINHFT